MLIRAFGTYPEGVSLAILIMNLLVPLMDKYILPVRFGELTKRGKPRPEIMKWTMRALLCAMALALAVAVPVLATRPLPPFTPQYVQSYEREDAAYRFETAGSAYIMDGYSQELAFTVYIDPASGTVTKIEPVKQSTMGYTAELAFFIGRTRAQIEGLTDLSTDATTSATRTNTALRAMVLECFEVMERAEAGNG